MALVQFSQCLQRELATVKAEKNAFVTDFSEEDFNEVIYEL